MKEKDKNTIGIRSFQFSEIGIAIPQYSETANVRGTFINFGGDNLMPNYYIELLDRSAIHNAIVHQKSSMVSGNGWNMKGLSNEALNFIRNIANDEDLEEIVAKIGIDLEVFGAFALNIVWSNDRKKIAEINYMTPQSIRIAIPDPKFPTIEKYWVSKNWGNVNKEQNKPCLYPGFSLANRQDASQILYVKNYMPGKYFYGIPEYISGVRWIEMSYEISDFHLNNIKNGFALDKFINFPTGIPTDEEMGMNDRKLQRQLSGAKGAGKVFITYSENKDTAPIITTIDSNANDTKYIELIDKITEGILASHRVNDPALFGLQNNEGAMFVNQTQILNSLEIFRAQYIIPKQRFIEKCFNRLARINGIQDKLELSEYELNFAKMDLSIQDVLSIMSAPISKKAKQNMLVMNGYSEDDAEKILEQDSTSAPSTPSEPVKQEAVTTNDNLKNMTGRQMQNLMRIIKKYDSGSITKEIAISMIVSGFGLSKEEAITYLNIEEEDTQNNPTK